MTPPTSSPPQFRRRSSAGLRRVRTLLIALLGSLGLFAGVAAPSALAEPDGDISIVARDAGSKPSGSPSTYTITVRCSTVTLQECGDNPVVRIPLDLTSTRPDTPAMDLTPPDPRAWAYAVTSGVSGLIVGTPQIVNGELVIELDANEVRPGRTLELDLQVTPPNHYTPNGTSWSLDPKFKTDEIPEVTAPDPAVGSATAAPSTALTKEIHDGSSFVIKGNDVIYTVKPTCGTSSTGNLYLKSGSLVDKLPVGLTFAGVTPAAPAPTVTGTPATGQTLTWNYGTTTALPAGCAAGATGPNEYTIRATIDVGVDDGTVLTNEATFTGLPIGRSGTGNDPADQPVVREDDAPVRILDFPPTTLGPGWLSKSSVGPLSYQDGNDLRYIGTYPGNWMPNAVSNPSVNNPASAPGRYTTTIDYGGEGSFQTDLVDPMPCMTNSKPTLVDRNFHSLDVLAPTTPGEQPVVASNCTTPAFNPTYLRISALSLKDALDAGWRPTAILTDGSSITLPLVGTAGATSYFEVPTANRGNVAAIRLTRHADLTDRLLRLDVFGYAHGTTQGMDILTNIVSSSAYPENGANPITATDDARLVIEDSVPQLGAHKSFGATTTYTVPGTDERRVRASMTLIGRVATSSDPLPLVGDVVIADLLPSGMQLNTAPGPVSYRLTDTFGATASTVTGTLEYLENYQSTGKNLVRITFPRAAFAGPGFYTLEPQTPLTISVPVGANSYNNQTRTYVKGSGRNVSSTCTQGTTSTPATIQSVDSVEDGGTDLDGDGVTAQRSCSWNATLNVPPPSGSAFGLFKAVKGDRDDAFKLSPGVGEASEGGSGEYTLTWRTIGSAPLSNAIVYDVLPYVGDTGVMLTNVPRGSAFQPVFTGMIDTPAGVTVQYSTSSNPCRPEVLAVNPGCDANWTTSPPSSIGDVRALRFEAAGPFPTNQGFTVKFGIDVPPDYVNVIAWNSSASVADRADGSTMAPAEPPKVGIRAPGPIAEPTLTTQVSKAKVVVGTEVHDTITLAGTKGASGDIDWKLVGPKPAINGSCGTVDWTGAAQVAAGTIQFQGNGDYDTAKSTLTAFGCYSYVVSATSADIKDGEVSHAAGATNEVVQVAPVTPTLSTEVSQATIGAADTVFDTITLTDNADASGTLSWKLVGPKPIGSDGTCDNVTWTGAATVANGTLPFAGNGDYDTPTTALAGAGCYSYVVDATSAQYSAPVGHPAGAVNEVVLVRPATIVTEASSIRIAPGAEITDSIELSGTGNGNGTLEWKLVGPIRAAADGTCQNLDWSGAQTFESGTITVNGDGKYVTDPSSPTETGCYSYVQLLNAASSGGPSLHAAGEPNEMFYVGRPSVETTVSSPSILPGGTLLDTIDVKGTGGGAGTLEWKLYGPVLPGLGDTCLGLDWTNATVIAQGTLAVTGDGTYLTPPTLPLLLAGCYGYEVTLTGKDYGDPVVSPAGTPGELSLVKAPIVPQSNANVSITKTASHASVQAGSRVTYTLTATNSGPGAAQDVVITDTPQSAMTFVSASTGQGSCTTGFPLTCNVGTIPSGGKVTVTVVAIPKVSGAVVNAAKVTTPTPNESPANEVVADSRITVKVPVAITKRASAKTVTAGKRVSFTVKITNRSKVASGRAQVCDRMPSGMVLVSVRGAKVTRKGGEHCWTVPALKPGKSKSYRVTARVLGGAKGKQTNRVTIKGDSVRTKSARATVKVRAVPVRAGGVTG